MQDPDFNYIKECQVTLSNKFHSATISPEFLKYAMQDFILAGEKLDACKKALFYNREIKNPLFKVANEIGLKKPSEHNLSFSLFEKKAENIFHGCLGIATESIEIIQLIYGFLFEDKELDEVNLTEEIGDCFWYVAIMLKEVGVTFNDVQHQNINKLRARFPDKFTEYDANNRDLFAERAILEAAAPGNINRAGDLMKASIEIVSKNSNPEDSANGYGAYSMQTNCDSIEDYTEEFKTRLKSLKTVTIQSKIDSTNNSYLRGMANGLILAEAIMNAKQPEFIPPPKNEAENSKDTA